jgi:hypothetical protein
LPLTLTSASFFRKSPAAESDLEAAMKRAPWKHRILLDPLTVRSPAGRGDGSLPSRMSLFSESGRAKRLPFRWTAETSRKILGRPKVLFGGDQTMKTSAPNAATGTAPRQKEATESRDPRRECLRSARVLLLVLSRPAAMPQRDHGQGTFTATEYPSLSRTRTSP